MLDQPFNKDICTCMFISEKPQYRRQCSIFQAVVGNDRRRQHVGTIYQNIQGIETNCNMCSKLQISRISYHTKI